jgi:carbon-monoxide dehydrogenase medium subunit
MVGAAALAVLDDQGNCQQARLVYLSVGERPVLAAQAVARLQGQLPTPGLIAEAAEAAATLDIDPVADIHASAAYRRQLARVLAQRTLARAFERAGAR